MLNKDILNQIVAWFASVVRVGVLVGRAWWLRLSLAGVRVGRCSLGWKRRNAAPSGTGIPLPVGGEGETEGLRDGGQRRSVTKVISTLPQIRLMEKRRDHPLLSIEEDCGKPTPHFCLISKSINFTKNWKEKSIKYFKFISSLLNFKPGIVHN